MRNVTREPQPKSLRENAKSWTESLLKEIKRSKKSSTRVPDRYYNKYKQGDVRDALRKMYGDDIFCYCCYCESIINDVSYDNIEHRMPMRKSKDKYPERAFDWDNLNLACELCNRSKDNRFDEKAPILDPTNSEPITKHLGYKLSDTRGVYRETLSRCGITTVQHAKLDRPALRTARLKVWNATMKAIQEIKQLGDDPRAYTSIEMLWDKCEGEHGSLISYLLNTWGISDVREYA